MKLKSPSRAAATLLIGMALFVATTIFAQKLSAERAADATTTKLVCEMVIHYHISQGEINDETSKKLLKRYLKQMDPLKLYLLASDVESFQPNATKLDDLVKSGNVDFAYDVFKLYLDRLDQRMAVADKLIDANYDFSLDEEMVVDADLIHADQLLPDFSDTLLDGVGGSRIVVGQCGTRVRLLGTVGKPLNRHRA